MVGKCVQEIQLNSSNATNRANAVCMNRGQLGQPAVKLVVQGFRQGHEKKQSSLLVLFPNCILNRLVQYSLVMSTVAHGQLGLVVKASAIKE